MKREEYIYPITRKQYHAQITELLASGAYVRVNLNDRVADFYSQDDDGYLGCVPMAEWFSYPTEALP